MIVELKSFSHLIEDGDATLALQEALYLCKRNPGSTLKLGGGTYNFSKKYAFEKEYYISNNDYSKKSIIFPLIGMDNVTVDGEGAELQFHGEVLPFVIDDSRGVCIKNLSVDYPHPYFFQADIVDAKEDYLEIEFDESQFDASVDGIKVVFTNKGNGFRTVSGRFMVCEFDNDTTAPSAKIPPYFIFTADESDGWFLDRMYRYVKPSRVSSNRISFKGHFNHTHTVGNKLICTCGPGRRCPGMLGNNSEDTKIENVTIYSSAGMGIVCQTCKNVTLEGVKMIPNRKLGRCLSVNADATHFVNCSGFVRLEGCTFTNMLDDALNCHGNYLKYLRMVDDSTMLLTFGHHQQKGVNIFRPGDTVRIIDNVPMTSLGTLTVKDSYLISENYLRLELEGTIPEMKDGYTVENLSQMPELYINNCTSGYNRPRGFLPSTWKKTVITNNTFFNMYTALHFTGDSNDWFEACSVSDVLVKGNRFVNSAYAGGDVICIQPHVKGADTKYHKNIIIEDNYFELHDERFLNAGNVENLVFRNNTFHKNENLPAHSKQGTDGFAIHDSCSNVTIEKVKYV